MKPDILIWDDFEFTSYSGHDFRPIFIVLFGEVFALPSIASSSINGRAIVESFELSDCSSETYEKVMSYITSCADVSCCVISRAIPDNNHCKYMNLKIETVSANAGMNEMNEDTFSVSIIFKHFPRADAQSPQDS